MVTVYDISIDVSNYQWVVTSDAAAWRTGLLEFDCSPKEAIWNPPKFYVDNPKRKKGNFFHVGAGMLAFDQKVKADVDVLAILEGAGEILPIELETGETLFLLNVLDCVNALDREKTVYRRGIPSGTIIGVTKYVFHKERFHISPIFKVPETSKCTILVRDDGTDELNFRRLILDRGYTGLIFEELWSG